MAEPARPLPARRRVSPPGAAPPTEHPGPSAGRGQGLAVTPDTSGPHVRLGLCWAVVTFAVAAAGPVWLGAWMAAAAAAGAAQAARSWRRRPNPPAVAVAACGAAILPLAAVAGPLPAVAGAALVVVASEIHGVAPGGRGADPVLTSVLAGAVGLAAAAPVVLRREGVVPTLVLLAFACVHDASAYLVGSGSWRAWEGHAAGVASIGAVTLAVAAVLVPPFRGATPWLLGGLAAVLAPLGPYAGSALLGDRRARAPALRRLDSLLVLGPLWVLAAVLLGVT